MDYKNYRKIKSDIERDYRYYCFESCFRNDEAYVGKRALYKELYRRINEWEQKTIEKALRGLDDSFFMEV